MAADTQSAQYRKMTETPVEKLIATLAVPTVLSMLVTNLYNMVDTAFVGTLGNSATGAVGVVFGFMAIIQAVGFMCGQGAGSLMARSLGQKDTAQATRFSSTGFFFSFSLGLLISVLSLLFLSPLVYALGSTDTIAPYAKSYIIWIILAAPFMTSSYTLNNLLRYEGLAKLGMLALMSGAILNIALDAVFIFVFRWGIAGAATATASSQLVSFCILLSMFLRHRTQTEIHISKADFHLPMLMTIATTGFPSLLRQVLNSIATILLNSTASAYGDVAVAAMSVVSRISFFVVAIALGICQGFQPVCSFNFGAGRMDRVKRSFWFTLGLAEFMLILVAIPVFLFARPVVRIFRDDADVVFYAVRALKLQLAASVCIPLTMVTEMSFQTTGQRFLASFASSLRSGLIFVPTLLVLSSIRGMAGIQEAQPLAFVISFVISLFLARVFLKRIAARM